MKGVIAAGSRHAAEAGAAMLRLGGNAVDAAVAAAWASFVAEMTVVNLGGGGYATVWSAQSEQQAAFYDFFCAMPSGTIGSDLDFHKIEIDFGPARQAFHIGRGSTAVPGVVSGLCTMASQRGSLPLKTILQPAIDLAENGFTASAGFVQVLGYLAPIFADTPDMKHQFSRAGNWIQAGDRLRFPLLAETFRKISESGPSSFYRGQLAVATVADHRRFGGLIQETDLAEYQTHTERPRALTYRDGTVYVPDYSSLGGRLTGFTLGLLNALPLQTWSYGSPQHVRAWAHAMRLTSEARRELERGFGEDHALADAIWPKLMDSYRQALCQSLQGRPEWHHSHEPAGPSHTSHISAMDETGTAISLTTSSGESAGYLISGTGMPTNNVLGEEDLNPDGWHRHRPGKRLVSMMSPILFCKAGQPRLSLGSAGSNRLRSAIVQTLSSVIDFGLTPDAAINAPRMHFESGVLNVEPGFSEDALDALAADGFSIKRWSAQNIFFGGAQAVAASETGFLAGADKRRNGAVAVVS